MFTKQFAITALLVAASSQSFCQNDSADTKRNIFTAGVTYQSRLHYFGRTDSEKSQGLFSTIGYELKQGFYASTNIIFVNNAATSFNYTGTVIEGGYKFPETKNFSGNVFYSQFLYKNNSTLVQSSLKSEAGINGVYNNNVVNVNLGGDLKFSNKTDFGLTAGLDHLFIYLIPDTKNALAVNPSIYLYAGSQNFTETYSENRNRRRGGSGQRITMKKGSGFNILAYEFSAPIVFIAGKFNASFTGSYAMPQHLYVVANRPDLSETGSNMFYFSAGIGVRL